MKSWTDGQGTIPMYLEIFMHEDEPYSTDTEEEPEAIFEDGVKRALQRIKIGKTEDDGICLEFIIQ